MVFTNIKTAQQLKAEAFAAAKAQKASEIKAHYSALGATLTHGGYVWQTDDKAIGRLNGVFSALKGGLIETPPEWRTANDQMVPMDTEEFLAFAGAVFAQQQATLAAMWAHLAAVEALETVEAVIAYAVE
jgi:hypothetical protein